MSMEQYMGYRAGETQPEKERELPVWNIAGTEFLVDIKKHEFRQVDDPYNRMTLGDVSEESGFRHFLYDTHTRNIYLDNTGFAHDVPAHVRIILVPPLKELDPIGLAMRQGLQPPRQETPRREQRQLTSLAPKAAPKKKQKGKHL